MEQENVHAQEEIVEQEEQISEEESNQEVVEQEQDNDQEEKITLTKSEYNKLNRRAIAYQATKKDTSLSKPSQESVNISPERLDRIELMQEGYSKEEVDTIMELGGRSMLNNPIVKGAIQVIRQQEKSKNASQNLSSKSPVFKKYTQDDLNKLSASEMEKVLQG